MQLLGEGGNLTVSFALQGRYGAVVDIHLLLIQEGRILLGQRQNTGFGDGSFHLPAGHLEQGETIINALLRESLEELGITIRPEDVHLALVLHQKSNEGRLGLFFAVRRWEGAIQNMEPNKCQKLVWFDLDNLPENMIPYARYAIQQYRTGSMLALYGWASNCEQSKLNNMFYPGDESYAFSQA
jgi:8-oxo-dGTP pyrophosphatase MutT (NUDIX family)